MLFHENSLFFIPNYQVGTNIKSDFQENCIRQKMYYKIYFGKVYSQLKPY